MTAQPKSKADAPANVTALPQTALEAIAPEADQIAVVGTVIKHPELFVELRQIINPDDFGYVFWREAWRVFDGLSAEGVKIDLNETARGLDALGGSAIETRKRLVEAIGLGASKPNAKHYAQRVRDGATKILIYNALLDSRNLVLDPSTNSFVDGVIETVLRNLHGAVQGRHGRNDSLQDVLNGIVERMEFAIEHPGQVVTAFPTGFTRWDGITNGIPVGEVTVLMGYTGHGKTTFSTQVARYNAKQGRHVLLFTREQTSEEVLDKLVSFESGIQYDVIRFRKVSPAKFEEFINAGGVVSSYIDNMTIMDRQDLQNGFTPALVRLKVDECLAKGLQPLVVLDGLWLMSPDKAMSSRGESNWWMELQQITWELTQIASRVDHEVPVLLLHQTNENPMTRVHQKGAFLPRESDADGGKKSMFNVQTLWSLVNPRFMGVKDSTPGESNLYVVKSRAGVPKLHRQRFYFNHERYVEA